ncbi:hypothetical protein TPA0910_54930 [Streptomyces hygroscopicus subsp. sporocinereus]|uniref:Uncharacterized protein n=1 Tax=Streptomyces hygroscopicus TaxID=1912 RepID=A0ABQ3U630_STRHY|nr:hypothetical protein TPA0910_54930 [Streptomyces hygroscopicus]
MAAQARSDLLRELEDLSRVPLVRMAAMVARQARGSLLGEDYAATALPIRVPIWPGVGASRT